MTPAAAEFTLEVSPCGSKEHHADLEDFRRRSLPVPHPYRSWWKHDRSAEWLWCRAVADDGTLLAAFALELTASRMIPWARIGRIERIGRQLHSRAAPLMGEILATLADATSRLLRLHDQVFDECPDRRTSFEKAIGAAGGIRVPRKRSYGRTLILDVGSSDEAFLESLSQGARRKIRAFSGCPEIRIRTIHSSDPAQRMEQMHRESFKRTGARPPHTDFLGIIQDAATGSDSVLLGAFLAEREAPADLVGYLWGRLHGDHVSYDVAATERTPETARLAPGYSLVVALARWARGSGASWLDLGGIPARSDSESNLAGIRRFKTSFSKVERIVASEYEFMPRSTLARAGAKLSRLAQLLPL